MASNPHQERFSLEMDCGSSTSQTPQTSEPTCSYWPINSATGSTRSYLSSQGPTVFSLEDFFYSQKLRRTQVDHRSFQSERFHIISELQHVKSQYVEKNPRCPFLHDVNRCKTCLLARTREVHSPQVPGDLMRQPAVLLSLPSLWTSSSPNGFHGGYEVPNVQTESSGNQCAELPRRLSYMGQVHGADPDCHQDRGKGANEFGISIKSREIQYDSFTGANMARDSLEFQRRVLQSAGQGYPKDRIAGGRAAKAWTLFEKDVGVSDGPSSICGSNIPQSQIAFASPYAASSVSRAGQGQYFSDTSPVTQGSQAMATSLLPLSNSASSTAFPYSDNMDRCQSGWLGGPLLPRRYVVGKVGSPMGVPSYQCPGAASGVFGSTESGNIGHHSIDRHRQLYNCGSNQQSGLSFPTDPRNCNKAVSSSRDQGASYSCSPHSGVSQCSSRFSFEGFTSGDGMGASPDRIRSIRELARVETPDRSVCYTIKPQDSRVCFDCGSPKSVSTQCLCRKLGCVVSNLPISSHKPSSTSGPKITPISRARTTDNSESTECRMVPVCSEEEQDDSLANTSVSSGSREKGHGLISAVRRLDRREFLKLVYKRSFSENVSRKLLKGFRASSMRQYEVGWEHFQKWLPPALTTITKSDVLEFLVYLEGVVGSSLTIKAYRNALKLPLSKGFGIDFSDEDFAHLARAQYLDNPPTSKVVPQWSLEEALEVIRRKRALRLLSFKEQFLITLFLTAVATGSRVSELASIDRRTISFAPRSLEATLPVVPGFLYKNQSANRRPPAIVIPALGKGSILCPVEALKLYLKNTEDSTSPKLFINPESGRVLNAGTISYWLCKSINYLLPNAICHAHDTRKASFSLAWARGVPSEEIVKKGFWSNSNVFIKRYLIPNNTSKCRTRCIVAGQKV